MKRLLLAALAGLVGAATAFLYPPITSDHEDMSKDSIDKDTERYPRYLRVDNATVVNATTIAIASFYVGTVALGVMSILNDAANSVGAYKRRRKRVRAKVASADSSFDDSNFEKPVNFENYPRNEPVSQPAAADDEYAKYEQELKDYKTAYAEYLANYKAWAEQYGQDATPPEAGTGSSRISRYLLLLYFSCQITTPNFDSEVGALLNFHYEIFRSLSAARIFLLSKIAQNFLKSATLHFS